MLAKRSGASGKVLLAPGSRSGGAFSSTPPPASAAPAQFEIHVVRMSAQASVLASQQLWPPATLATMRESRGELKVTMPFAAA